MNGAGEETIAHTFDCPLLQDRPGPHLLAHGVASHPASNSGPSVDGISRRSASLPVRGSDFSLLARRLHDTGVSAWILLLYPLAALPVVGALVGLTSTRYSFAVKGDSGPNKLGTRPYRMCPSGGRTGLVFFDLRASAQDMLFSC